MPLKIKLIIALLVLGSVALNAYWGFNQISERAAQRIEDQAVGRGLAEYGKGRVFRWKDYQLPHIQTAQNERILPAQKTEEEIFDR